MRVGFIGVGKMGAPMALRVAGAGHQVMVYDNSQEAAAAIAGTDGISKCRVQHMIDLGFLAPDFVRDVLAGKRPLGFTTDWCKGRALPADWHDQRALLATL